MKKIKFPIVWILLLAAICALTAALAKNIKWVRQEFPMDGSNVSQLDSAQIAGKIAKTQKLKNSEALYVNADNFELRLTKEFDFENGGTIRFFYYNKWGVYSAQLRIFSDSGKFFVTERSGCTCSMKTRQHKKEKTNGGMSGSIAAGQFFCKFGACHAALARI